MNDTLNQIHKNCLSFAKTFQTNTPSKLKQILEKFSQHFQKQYFGFQNNSSSIQTQQPSKIIKRHYQKKVNDNSPTTSSKTLLKMISVEITNLQHNKNENIHLSFNKDKGFVLDFLFYKPFQHPIKSNINYHKSDIRNNKLLKIKIKTKRTPHSFIQTTNLSYFKEKTKYQPNFLQTRVNKTTNQRQTSQKHNNKIRFQTMFYRFCVSQKISVISSERGVPFSSTQTACVFEFKVMLIVC
eukprot:TRINITY_DN17388_c2_g1_i2.p1 TRINITY_DN17388_c2_g1~~TRINITY_DN17388_c2_g1_i2.p1  ORF type:complete len:240 (-),score=-11.33 TRINITY_DN17388_c2_g1_i2:20-739(-)